MASAENGCLSATRGDLIKKHIKKNNQKRHKTCPAATSMRRGGGWVFIASHSKTALGASRQPKALAAASPGTTSLGRGSQHATAGTSTPKKNQLQGETLREMQPQRVFLFGFFLKYNYETLQHLHVGLEYSWPSWVSFETPLTLK